MAQTLLSLRNISFGHPGRDPILHDLNLEINRNDLLIVKGESGAGKSTFLKLFNRFCDYHEGNILLHDKELKEYNIDRLRSSMIYLPQLPVMIEGTVEDNLSFPFLFQSHRKNRYDAARAGEWLDYFQLNIPLDHDALKLSVGQKQRVALIRSMLLEPEVLLLDEPGSSLDSSNKRLIEQKIEQMLSSSGVTVIMATHSDVGFSDITYRTLLIKNSNFVLMPRSGS